MNSDTLRIRWKKIDESLALNGYKSIRIASCCFADVYLGIDNKDCHCLILNLPEGHSVNLRSIIKEKISIEFFPDTNFLIMKLFDSEYNDLFDDLIVSLFNAIKDIEEIDVYSKVFIQTFYKWNLFFTIDSNEKLSKDVIKGIWGELIVLKELILESEYCDVNDILLGWTGLYDNGHDFIYDDKNLEVKTKSKNKIYVTISSEYQLEVDYGKALYLTVVSVDDDMEVGLSLKDLVQDIKEIIFERMGDFSIILKALLQKNITLQNILKYNNYRFNLLNIHKYDCLNDGFPKITNRVVRTGISNVRYDINLTKLDKFLISSRDF